ncbi:VOC family protein [Magnetovibrio sp.]|uniref:VOC family protein n=1 Tax=Magnetovibrio sp. TaxID=2024836 RepID=UPI002F9417CB
MNVYRISILVTDLAKAKDFFVNVFGFEVIQDEMVTSEKRVIRVQPKNSNTPFHLVVPQNDEKHLIGQQGGNRALVILETEDVTSLEEKFKSHAVKIIKPLKTAPFGKVILVEDLVGNKWEFVERFNS